MNLIKNKKGLALSEALMAIAMVVIGAIVMSSIIVNSLQTTSLSKNYLIAQNLATEGIEAVKNIRDTNWILEPANKTCWLRRLPLEGESCADQVLPDTHYIVDKKGGTQWLIFAGSNKALDLEKEPTYAEIYHLYIKDMGDYKEYLHESTLNEPSIFYRSIYFVDKTDEYATLEVKVQWSQGAKVRTIIRRVKLFNFI